MIFASDLDQTLIFSYNFLKRYPAVDTAIKNIEKNEGKEISFIPQIVIKLLQELAGKLLFVPVTTRSIEQYRRISLFSEMFIPEYAVVSNGGNIIVNNQIDKAWNEKIKKKLANECMESSLILEAFNELRNEEWVKRIRYIDDLFFYCIVEKELIPWDELCSFEKWLNEQNWNISLQSRKLIFTPSVVNKWDAVEYIKNQTNRKKVFAAGDSKLDLAILEKADFSICPAHGELYETYSNGVINNTTFSFTSQSGINAAEELLNTIISNIA